MMRTYRYGEYMNIVRRFLKRYWSLFFACLIPVIVFYTDYIAADPMEFQNPVRVVWIMCLICAIVIALCLGLLVHSWQMQRRYARNNWRLVFWAHLLLLPALCTIVLVLRKIQVSTYDIALEREQFQYLHWYTGDVKDILIWTVPLDIILIFLWAMVAICKNESSRSATGPA
jgi:hypothetical protein